MLERLINSKKFHTTKTSVPSGIIDVIEGLKNIGLPAYLAFSDIRQRYRRSSLGPFWITISTAVMVGSIGLIFGNLFKTSMEDFLPFLTAGLIIWGLISSVLIDSTNVFVGAEAVIKQLPLPLFSHVERQFFRNLIIFFHNLIIFPFVCLIVGKNINFYILLVLPGLLLLSLNLLWISLVLSIICTRFRDLGQIVSSVLQVFFYLTPIMWLPTLLPQRASNMIIDCNPFYHLIEVVRLPLLGKIPSIENYLNVTAYLLIGWVVAITLFNKYRSRIPYWL